jgi:hypothetical protein
MITKPEKTVELTYVPLSKNDLENARQYLSKAIHQVEQTKWVEETRDDVLRTLKFVTYLLGGRP